jgi:hypothetical protein
VAPVRGLAVVEGLSPADPKHPPADRDLERLARRRPEAFGLRSAPRREHDHLGNVGHVRLPDAKMQAHAALKTRVAVEVHLEPFDRETFGAFIEHGLKAAGATVKLLSDPALELLFRTSRGVPRVASKFLRAALRAAHDRDQSFVDEHVLDAAIEELSLAPTGKP